jgi:hypothetical protein
METKSYKDAIVIVFVLIASGSLLLGCSKAYYGAMEQMGFHKRDILVDRVEAARDAQSEAQEQFKSALEQFGSVVEIENTDLKIAYENLNTEYEYSEKAATMVSDRIDKVESVAEDLFDEWSDELALYKSIELQNSSKQKLEETKTRYLEMLESMHRAESSMSPVLNTFRDNVLFLKHNLNAQAIGSLRTEFNSLKGEIDILMNKMNTAIEMSNQFIADIKQ